MIIKCIAIDDEPLALRQIEDFIKKTPTLEFIAGCKSAFEALKILESNEIDLMFVDINMPDLSGMDFIKSLSKPPKVIFTTAYSEYAIEGFKVEALDYLLKPISYTDFLQSASKAQKYFELVQYSGNTAVHDNEFLFIKSEYKIVKIKLNEIKYIEGMREYVRIHIINAKPVMTLMSMKTLEEKLPTDKFMRVHRSFIVNLSQISIVERNRIIFDKDVYIPISEQYKDQFQEFIDKHFMQ
jgi:two-component system, LytTR family, response regulator LytT